MASPKFGTTAPPNGRREKFLDDPNAPNVSRRVNRTSPSEIQLFEGPLRRETPAAAAASPSMRKNNVPPSRPRRSVLVPEFLSAFRCACCIGGRCELYHQSNLYDMRTISRAQLRASRIDAGIARSIGASMLRQRFCGNCSSYIELAHSTVHDRPRDIPAVESTMGLGSRAVMRPREGSRAASECVCMRRSRSRAIFHFSWGRIGRCGVPAPGW